jgi:hypothetical protein
VCAANPLKALIATAALVIACAANASEPYVPVKWTQFVKVEGQSEAVPAQWLQDAEAKIAYSLKLPESVPKAVPFNFTKAYWWSWLPGTPKQSVQYFDHLCSTEAGEWIFRKVPKVEGFYFARPQSEPPTDVMTDPYGPEMPWIQRRFMLTSDTPLDQGAWFIEQPKSNYRFVEQPRRQTSWQADIKEPFVRLFGYTREAVPIPGVYGKAYDKRDWYDWRDKTPMQVIGIPTLTAKYGYTWRGLKRARDREHGIAGGELLIYDLQTKEVLAVRRQFLIASHNPRGEGKAMWEVAARCSQLPAYPPIAEFSQFAFDILETIEPSSTGKK